MKAIIVGGGIGGLTTALMLRARGIDCELFEQSDSIRELGVGINTLPHAIRELAGLGLLDPDLALVQLHDLGAFGEGLAVAGRAGLVGCDHLGIGDDDLEHLVRAGGRDHRPILVALEIGEGDSPWRHQGIFLLRIDRDPHDRQQNGRRGGELEDLGALHGGIPFWVGLRLLLRIDLDDACERRRCPLRDRGSHANFRIGRHAA